MITNKKQQRQKQSFHGVKIQKSNLKDLNFCNGKRSKEAAFKYNYLTPDEYLLTKRASEEKHDYDGQVLAISGASLRNVRITRNLTLNIGSPLQGKECEILSGNMRVATPARDGYPDAILLCGKKQLEDNVFDTLLNPSVIFEILSLSTSGIDKGRKFFFYQQMISLP